LDFTDLFDNLDFLDLTLPLFDALEFDLELLLGLPYYFIALLRLSYIMFLDNISLGVALTFLFLIEFTLVFLLVLDFKLMLLESLSNET